MVNNLKKSSELIIYLCGVLLFSAVFMISAEVFLRKFFLYSFGGVDEIAGYVLGICITWSLSYVLFEKMHIRIDILYNKSKKQIRGLMDILSMFLTLSFTIFLAYYSAFVLFTSIEKGSTANTPLGTPLWIPQSIWFLGLVFFLFCVLVLFIKSVKSFLKNKIDKDCTVKKEYE